MQNTCILLTATVDPKGVPFMERSNPSIREGDYINAIEKWMRIPHPIVFCENSDYDLYRIENCVGERVEIIQFNGQDFPRELGKGYGEMQAIKYALENSKTIKECDYTVKVNGRYFIKNIDKIINLLSVHNDVYIMADLKKNLTWADSRVFIFRPEFISDYLVQYKSMINDSSGFYLEHALARAIFLAMSRGHEWMPLPVKPIIDGYVGTANSHYSTSKIRGALFEIGHSIKNYLNEI